MLNQTKMANQRQKAPQWACLPPEEVSPLSWMYLNLCSHLPGFRAGVSNLGGNGLGDLLKSLATPRVYLDPRSTPALTPYPFSMKKSKQVSGRDSSALTCLLHPDELQPANGPTLLSTQFRDRLPS